jgi:hypothetical protein
MFGLDLSRLVLIPLIFSNLQRPPPARDALARLRRIWVEMRLSNEPGKEQSVTSKQVTAEAEVSSAFSSFCARTCQRIISQINSARNTLFDESRQNLNGHERMLKLALNEAEALAWQTSYPHLLFPALAVEKIEGVVRWGKHQRAVAAWDLPRKVFPAGSFS